MTAAVTAPPYEVILPPDTPWTDVLKARRSGIGGSDLAALLGQSKWTTELALWHSKVSDLASDPETEAQHWGKLSEGMIRDEFAVLHPDLTVGGPPGLLRSAASPIAIGDPDGTAGTGILEIKTSGQYASRDWDDGDGIPMAYQLQALWYLGITGAPYVVFAVLIGGRHYLERTLHADPDLTFGYLLDRAADWWDRYVAAGVEPPARGPDLDLLRRIHAAADIERADLGAAEHVELQELSFLQAEIKRLDERAAVCKARIVQALHGAAEGWIGSTRAVTWRPSRPPLYTDLEALERDYPDAFAAVRKRRDTGARPLLITKEYKELVKGGLL